MSSKILMLAPSARLQCRIPLLDPAAKSKSWFWLVPGVESHCQILVWSSGVRSLCQILLQIPVLNSRATSLSPKT